MNSFEDLQAIISVWLFDPIIGKLVASALVLLLVVTIVKYAQRALGRYVDDAQRRYRLRKLVTFFGYLLTVLLLSIVFADRLAGLTVLLGVIGAGVAFALQEIIVSVAGWIALSFGRLYDVGDRVQVGGIKGDVIDIGVLRTTIMQIGEWVDADQYNGRIVRVANSFVFKEPVFNYSGEFPFLWDEIMVPIKYGSDYRLARQLIEQAAEQIVGDYSRGAEEAWERITRRYLIEKAAVRPMVTMVATQNWIEFTLRYVVDYKARRATKDRLFVRILEEIDRVPDQLGIAAATLNIEKLAPLDVRLTQN